MAKAIDSRRFHAFICYTKEDQSFVTRMADTLESKPYLLTCVRPDRDFISGLPVSVNIDQHLDASRRILFVLSDHSVKSPWYQTQIQSILKDRKKDVVVVRVGDITPPDYLQHVHTIQATSSVTEIWMTKLTRFLGYIGCITCEREGKQSKATVYCNNCRHGYCDTCKSQHRRQPETHLHKMVEYKNVNTDYKQSRFTEDLTLDELKVDVDFDKFQCDLSTQEVKCLELGSGDRKMGTPVLNNKQTLGDVGFIWDMCVVTRGESDYIIMASDNMQVHCFDIRDSTMISSLSVEDSAGSITAVSDSRVAVSLPGPHRLLLVDVSPHLSLHSTHKTSELYVGLATLTPSTLVACGPSQSVDILDLTGRLLRSVCTDQQLTTLFINPLGVCISRTGNIIVADNNKNCVTGVSDTGEEVFTYLPTGDRKLNGPTCVKCNKAGDVFVRDTNKLVQLTSSGLYVRDVIRRGEEDVGYIYSMCCDSQGNMCVVLNKESDELVMNTYRFT